jgi:hypothetical protein
VGLTLYRVAIHIEGAEPSLSVGYYLSLCGTGVVMHSHRRLPEEPILLRIETGNGMEGEIMMNSKVNGFLVRGLMFAMLGVLAMPVAISAQGRGRGKPTEVFVNGHDARDGRLDKDQNRRRDRDRDDRWDNDNRRRNDDWRNRNDDWRNRNRNGRANDGYGNYGGSFDLRQTALNAGFADGAKEGRKDRSRNERFEFRDESGFQNASRDYSSRLGSRQLYQTYYRQAFENGYRDGYAGY